MWKIFRRIQMLLANGLFLVTGISMFLNAALFQWLMMKGNPPFEHPWLADSAYLYFMGAALFWPMFLMNVLNLGFDLASRYFIDEPILMTVAKGLIGIYIVILLYMGVRIILMIRPIALALGPQSGITRRRAFWQVAVRLYSAQFITAFLLEIVLLGIIMGIAFGIDLSDTITNG